MNPAVTVLLVVLISGAGFVLLSWREFSSDRETSEAGSPGTIRSPSGPD